MKREDLLKSRDYSIFEIQNKLYNVMEEYRKIKKLSKTQLASELGFTKGYITQVLNGDFDHKISKLVDLALACNMMPLIYFVDLEKFIKNDARNVIYEIVATPKPIPIEYTTVEPSKRIEPYVAVKFHSSQQAEPISFA